MILKMFPPKKYVRKYWRFLLKLHNASFCKNISITLVFENVVKVLKWILSGFTLEFWKYTVLSQSQTDTAVWPVDALFYSALLGADRVTMVFETGAIFFVIKLAANRSKSQQIAANRSKSQQIAANRSKSRSLTYSVNLRFSAAMCFPRKPYTLSGFEPVPWAETMTTISDVPTLI
jgi:hypothetical protein